MKISNKMSISEYRDLIKKKPQGKSKSSNSSKSIDPKTKIEFMLMEIGLPFKKEHAFHPTRKWRFDYAFLDKKLAIEYEGIFGGGKSRHTTVTGYTADAEKYNAAQSLGWTVLRYTAKNYTNITRDINEFLKKH